MRAGERQWSSALSAQLLNGKGVEASTPCQSMQI